MIGRILPGALAVLALVACGGGRPAYCASRTNLETAIKGLRNVSPAGGIGGLEAQLGKVEREARALALTARSNFPDQTGAIISSLDGLRTALELLPPRPSAAELVIVVGQAGNVVSAVESFIGATSAKCG